MCHAFLAHTQLAYVLIDLSRTRAARATNSYEFAKRCVHTTECEFFYLQAVFVHAIASDILPYELYTSVRKITNRGEKRRDQKLFIRGRYIAPEFCLCNNLKLSYTSQPQAKEEELDVCDAARRNGNNRVLHVFSTIDLIISLWRKYETDLLYHTTVFCMLRGQKVNSSLLYKFIL